MDHAHLKQTNEGMMIDEKFTGACNVCFQNIRDEQANSIFRFFTYGSSKLRNKDGTERK